MELRELTATPVDMLVGFSHEKVGQSVAELFTDKGHRRFAVVSTRDARAEVRKAGFLSTLERHGFTESVVADVPVPSNFRMGREGLRQILESGFRPQAVFCSSDFLAHGVLAEAQAQGLSVPEDLAIVGFIDLDFAAYTSPPLSTVRVDRGGIGRKAAGAILAAIEGRNKDRIVDVGFQIIERGTT